MTMPSVLWHCWLGIRRSIWLVKIEWWGVAVVVGLEWGADCLRMVHLMPLHPKASSSLASFKFNLMLPFRLTQVVLEKRPLNRRSSSTVVVVVLAMRTFQLHVRILKTIYCWKNDFWFCKVQWPHFIGEVDGSKTVSFCGTLQLPDMLYCLFVFTLLF